MLGPMTVYHATSRDNRFTDRVWTWPHHYQAVARVETDDLDTAFRLTNSIDRPWWKNEGVEILGAPEHRSTSVGDVIVDAQGNLFHCAVVGWKAKGAID